MDSELLDYIFKAVVCYLAASVTVSVNSLNKKVALILEKIGGHSDKIDDHGGRLRTLEQKQ